MLLCAGRQRAQAMRNQASCA